ncbi:MAG: EAL domain-containing protein [Oscillospiraceae bacterium]
MSGKIQYRKFFTSAGAFFNRMGIKKKITLILLLGFVVPSMAVMTLFVMSVYNQMTDREDTLIEGEMKSISLSVKQVISSLGMISDEYATNKDIVRALETYGYNDSYESLEDLRRLDTMMLSDKSSHDYIASISVYCANDNIFTTDYLRKITPDVEATAWYQLFEQSSLNAMLCVTGTESAPQVTYLRRLNMLNTGTQNFIKIDLSAAALNTACRSDVFADTTNYFYLISADGITVAKGLDGIASAPDGDRLTFTDAPLLNGWTLRVSKSEHVLTSAMSRGLLILGGMIVFTLALTMLSFRLMTSSIVRRLEFITHSIKQSGSSEPTLIRGDLGRDEIGEITKQYNNMIARTNELMDDLRKSNADVQDLLAEKTEAFAQLSEANEDLAEANAELLRSLDDINERDQRIRSLVYMDSLTKLDNRYAITGYIKDILRSCDENYVCALAFLDIDDFKYINDSYGHDVGDEVIKKVADILSEIKSDKIKVARMGGDEFLIFCSGYTEMMIIPVAEHIRSRLKDAITIESVNFRISVSIGIAVYPSQGFTMHELTKKSDIALYRAKELGKDRTVVFTAEMNDELNRKIRLHELIRAAYEEEQFYLVYQPYFDAVSGTPLGCEALIRWRSEAMLDVSPYELIKNVEEMGLIISLGEWIFIQAGLFAKKINTARETPFPVSINISAIQLMQPDFVERIAAAVALHELDPGYICLEMTETVLMNSIEKGSYIIHKLRSMGFGISLDDFGTGYSSLKYFKDLPITILKIDKGFIDRIAENAYDRQLVGTMILLAHNKSLAVIAEGVEHEPQREQLVKLGCDNIQGYLFSRPVPEQTLEALLQ